MKKKITIIDKSFIILWPVSCEDIILLIKNFKKYEGNEHGKALVSAGPQL